MHLLERSNICDYFVVMSASSTVRVKTIAERIEEKMSEEDYEPNHREGLQEAMWVLLDYGDVIVHIFYHETRQFYDLENLWGDAPRKQIAHDHFKRSAG